MPNVSVRRRLGMASAVGLWSNAVSRLSRGATDAYRVDAVFEGARGVGNRTDNAARPCSLTSVQ